MPLSTDTDISIATNLNNDFNFTLSLWIMFFHDHLY